MEMVGCTTRLVASSHHRISGLRAAGFCLYSVPLPQTSELGHFPSLPFAYT